MTRASIPLVLILGALVAGCGDRDAARWDGPPTPLSADGILPLDAFGTYVSEVEESWETSAVGVVTAYALPLARDARSLTTTQRAEGRFVVATIGGLADDSVRDLRLAFALERDGEGGTFTVSSARWTQRCHRGRGHQSFSVKPCI